MSEIIKEKNKSYLVVDNVGDRFEIPKDLKEVFELLDDLCTKTSTLNTGIHAALCVTYSEYFEEYRV